MKTALRNIFDDKSVRTIYGTVVKKVGSGVYIIETDIGNQIRVKSALNWSLSSKVICQNGIIISAGKKESSFQVVKLS